MQSISLPRVTSGRQSGADGVARSGFSPSNGEFVKVMDACRESGGLARAQEVVSMAVSRCGPDVRTLALWILDRQLLSFEWQSQIWIPLFQFDRATMALHHGMDEVLLTLDCPYCPWQQAMWFSRPHSVLGGGIPAQVIALDCQAVQRAAQADYQAAHS